VFTVNGEQAEGSRSLTGTVRALERSELGFEISGLVRSVNVRLDSEFSKGDILAELDAATLQLGVTAAESQLRGAQARREEARLNYERIRPLAASGAVSGSVLDTARTGLESAEASVAALSADLARARETMGFAKLRAPYAGRVSQRLVEPGQVIQAGQPVLSVAMNSDSVEVVVNVPGRLRATLAPGARVQVIDADQHTFDGHVTELGASAIQSGLFPAVVRLDNVSGLKPGASVRVSIEVAPDVDTVRIPLTALLAEPGDRAAVWVLSEDGTVRKQTVELRQALSDWAVLGAGLRPGDRIVSRGAPLLREGERVIAANSGQLIFNR
jgi:RND family efflux transporter MFP subunit